MILVLDNGDRVETILFESYYCELAKANSSSEDSV